MRKTCTFQISALIVDLSAPACDEAYLPSAQAGTHKQVTLRNPNL